MDALKHSFFLSLYPIQFNTLVDQTIHPSCLASLFSSLFFGLSLLILECKMIPLLMSAVGVEVSTKQHQHDCDPKHEQPPHTHTHTQSFFGFPFLLHLLFFHYRFRLIASIYTFTERNSKCVMTAVLQPSGSRYDDETQTETITSNSSKSGVRMYEWLHLIPIIDYYFYYSLYNGK